MDPASVTLIISLVAKGVGVAKEIAALAIRTKNGEVITEAEVNEAEAAAQASCKAWDAEADRDRAD
jgi:hypothetical protein